MLVERPREDLEGYLKAWSIFGYSPAMIAAPGTLSQPIFTEVFEKRESIPTGFPFPAPITQHRFDLFDPKPWPDPESSHPLALNVESTAQRRVGYVARWLACYSDPWPNPRYAAIFERFKSPFAVYWNIVSKQGVVACFQTVNAMAAGWHRAEFITRSHYGFYAGIYHDTSIGPMSAEIEVTADELEDLLVLNSYNGFYPFRLQAGGDHDDPRFCVLFAQRYTPTKRTFRAKRLSPVQYHAREFSNGAEFRKPSGGRQSKKAPARELQAAVRLGRDAELKSSGSAPRAERLPSAPEGVGFVSSTHARRQGGDGPPGPQEQPAAPSQQSTALYTEQPSVELFQKYMRSYLRAFNVRGGSLAVTKDARLVFAGGFTYAEPDYPDVLPTSPGQLYSVSKTITALAICQLIERNGLDLGANFVEKLNLKTPSGGTPLVGNWPMITIGDVLGHLAGFGGTLWDPVAVAGAFNHPLPVQGAEEVASWLAGQGAAIFVNPYGEYNYSNLGYVLAGQVVPAVTKFAYVDYVRDRIFRPLGIDSVNRTAARRASEPRMPNEMRYHAAIPVVGFSSVHADQRLVPVAYGVDDNYVWAAGGSWAMSTVDLVRILASFDLAETSDQRLLSPTLTTSLLFPSYWGLVEWPPDSGNYSCVNFLGQWAGAVCYFLRRNDAGICFAMIVNCDWDNEKSGALNMLPTWNGIAIAAVFTQFNTIADAITSAGNWPPPPYDLFPAANLLPLV